VNVVLLTQRLWRILILMRWLTLIAISAISAISLRAAQTSSEDDPKALLLEVRKNLLLTVHSLPNYMCTETVDRSMWEPLGPFSGSSCDALTSARKKTSWKIRQTESDRLRLDVAVSSGSEMFSWVGAGRFEERSLADLVGSGATSTGSFASLLSSIFATNDARFTFDGTSGTPSGPLAEFGFVVPLERSKYSVGNKAHRAVVKYEGTFLVDPKTFTLVQLTIHADDLPAELNVCEDTTILDYERIRLNGSEFLLPKDARFHVVGVGGSELKNRTIFSGCHEFRGESTLTFVPPAETTTTETRGMAKPAAAALPAGLPFTLTLSQSIDASKAAAGDVIKGKLTRAIRGPRREVLVPKGAVVTGRLVEVVRLYGAEAQSLRIGIKLETIESGGIATQFDAQLESAEKRTTSPHEAADDLKRREALGSFDEMSKPAAVGVAYLVFDGVTKDYTVQAGFEIAGKTLTRQ
jgi:hypothetical protein